MKSFYSNGKLLLTGEYVVLNGAKALAIPTKYGQYLNIQETQNKTISWKSFDDKNNVWFEADLEVDEIKKGKSFSDDEVKNTLLQILFHAHEANPAILNNQSSFAVETKLTFPKNWGLGTSSTVINNIAMWFEIDAFQLLQKSFGGSGYDIACAQNNSPIFYQLENEIPNVQAIDFKPHYSKDIYFVYLNQKQNSRSAIQNYFNKQARITDAIQEINFISEQLLTASFEQARNLITKHEIILSHILEVQTVKEKYFVDFDGVIKSLGAWGGDFVMVLSEKNPSEYFKNRGFDIIIPYQEMIL